ncbi:hypothetical protein RUND412_011439, partial [Rhizina undulata]
SAKEKTVTAPSTMKSHCRQQDMTLKRRTGLLGGMAIREVEQRSIDVENMACLELMDDGNSSAYPGNLRTDSGKEIF